MDTCIMLKPNPLGKNAVVVGAGMAGLMTATVLSEHFTNVLIIEKDRLPDTPALRKGVPQGAHVHTFLGFAVEAMEQLIPDLMFQLYEAGAVKIRRNLDFWYHDSVGPTPIRDVGILTPSITRPLLEHMTRGRVLALKNVSMREATRLLSFLTGPDGQVSGVTVRRSDGDREAIESDLVVDCSGRGGKITKWLKEQGYGAVPIQSLEIGMSYTSGLFRPSPKWRTDKWACLMLAIPPALRAAYLTPVDGGLWLATMYGRAGDKAPCNHDGFINWTRGLAHPCIYERLKGADPASKLSAFNIPSGIWRRFDRMECLPEGLLPLGDVFTCFNPMYGQGISLAAAQALSLRDALAICSDRNSLRGLAPYYFEACGDINATGWAVMETRDLAYSSTKGERPSDLENRWRAAAAVRQLAEYDPDVHELTVRMTHLMELPSSLEYTDVVDRALAEMGRSG